MYRKKFFVIYLLACLLIFIGAGCASEPEEPENVVPEVSEESSEPEEEIEYTEDYYDRLFFGDVISDENLRENIFAALVEININTEFIKEFRKAEDENGAEIYTFIYRENPFIVTINPDFTVDSVRVGEEGEDVYLKGYESYDVDDYIVTDSMINGFKSMNINAVEVALDYPKVYEFANDWTYKHEGDFYYVSGTVLVGEAKAEHFLKIVYYYDEPENTMWWYSLSIDGKALSIPMDFVVPEATERQPVGD